MSVCHGCISICQNTFVSLDGFFWMCITFRSHFLFSTSNWQSYSGSWNWCWDKFLNFFLLFGLLEFTELMVWFWVYFRSFIAGFYFFYFGIFYSLGSSSCGLEFCCCRWGGSGGEEFLGGENCSSLNISLWSTFFSEFFWVWWCDCNAPVSVWEQAENVL